jgi:hypothetical protein
MRRVLFSLTLVLVPLLESAAAELPTSRAMCREFRQLLHSPPGGALDRRALESSLSIGAKEDGYDHYFNVDVDRDDINDLVSRSCSASLTPSDPCMLEVKTSSGTSYTFNEEWRFFLVRHRAQIYAIASELGPDRKIGSGNIYRLGRNGVQKICSRL